MFTITLSVTFLLIGLALFAVSAADKKRTRAEKDRQTAARQEESTHSRYHGVYTEQVRSRALPFLLGGVSFTAIAALTFAAGSVVFMGTNVGVPTISGKPSGDVFDRGIHFKNPIADVAKFPNASDSIDLTAKDKDGNTTRNLETRSDTGQVLRVVASVQYKVEKGTVLNILKTSKDHEQLRNNRINPVAVSAVQDALNKLDPSDAVKGGTNLTKVLTDSVRTALQVEGVTVIGVKVDSIAGDESTQALIKEKTDAQARADIAESKTRAAKAEAATKLAEATAARDAAAERVRGLSAAALCTQYSEENRASGYIPSPNTANPCGTSSGSLVVDARNTAPPK